ncbi:MAG: hypothetical protein GX493_06175 [Firmicutes bacterium]|nr:hypothetical protein [Bacillota bacterium]
MAAVVAEKKAKAKPDWEEAAERGDFEAAVLALARRRDWLSFAEVARFFAEFCPADPWAEVLLPGGIVLWSGLPVPLAEAVAALLRDGRIYAWPVSPLVYFVDGRFLDLPIITPSPRGRWTWPKPGDAPRWWPVALRLARPVSYNKRWKEVRAA